VIVHNDKIGDSLDLAKRHLLSLLRKLGRPTLVAPLPSERDFDFELYSRVLDMRPLHTVVDARAGLFRRPGRLEHLAALREHFPPRQNRAILLDPSSGVSQTREDKPKYISCAEVHFACQGFDLWLLYHHQSTDRLTYCQAAQLVKALYFYNFGKAALIIGGKSQEVGQLAQELANSLSHNRLRNVRPCV
jgi:hypothetical protein